jgi:hypothetical protein
MEKTMKATILTGCILGLAFKLQGLVTYAPLETQALYADYVVIGKFISSTEVKASEDWTYSMDKFQLEKILVQNINYFSLLSRSVILVNHKEIKPNPEKIFCVFRVAGKGAMSPNVKDPKFKKGSSYLLAIKYLFPDKGAGMYAPLHKYQGFPLATKEFISEFMKKYKEEKQEQDGSIKLAAKIKARKIKEESKKIKPKPKAPKILGKIITVPGVKVNGAILIKHLDNTYYKKKCLHCGFVDVSSFGCKLQPAPWIMNINYDCSECDKITRGSISR